MDSSLAQISLEGLCCFGFHVCSDPAVGETNTMSISVVNTTALLGYGNELNPTV